MVEPMVQLRIDANTLYADSDAIPLNPYGYGEWAVLECVGKNTFRRYATDTDLAVLLENPKFSYVPVLFEQYPQYASIGSIFIYRIDQPDTLYLIAPKYTGHLPLTYTVGGKGVPR